MGYKITNANAVGNEVYIKISHTNDILENGQARPVLVGLGNSQHYFVDFVGDVREDKGKRAKDFANRLVGVEFENIPNDYILTAYSQSGMSK